MKSITKDQFVGILKEAGINEAQMKKLHQLFEAKYPEQHQAFLESLGVNSEKAREIRHW